MNTWLPDIFNEQGNAPVIPCLSLKDAPKLNVDAEKQPYQKLLVPFDSDSMRVSTLAGVIEMVRDVDGELILLHVGSQAELNEEDLFTSFRGLRMRIQPFVDSVTVDNLVADTVTALLDYAQERAVDLILLPEEQLAA